VSPRPASGVLDLTKIEAAGFVPAAADETLQNYVRLESNASQAAAR
jgi:dTDP-4-dehydrorhamnose 3,5-epimerase